MAVNKSLLDNALARGWLFPSGVDKCTPGQELVPCMAIDSISQDRGDVTRIECPSPMQYGEFDVVHIVPGEISQITTTLTQYFSRDGLSSFRAMFDKGCSFDLQLHLGLCQNPSQFGAYDKVLVLEGVYITSWGTDPIITLSSTDRAIVSETLDISASKYYELVPLNWAEQYNNVAVDGAFVRAQFVDSRTCGGCDRISGGCDRLVAVSDDGFIYYVDNDGVTAGKVQMDLVTPVATGAVDLINWYDYVVALDDVGNFHLVDRDDLFDGVAGTPDIFASNLGVVPAALDAHMGVGIVVGAGGVVGRLIDPECDVLVVDNSATTTENLLSVDVFCGSVLSGGENGAILFSDDDGFTYGISPTTPTADDVTAVAILSATHWLIGTDVGELWCTDNAGRTWSQVKYPGWSAATTPINDIQYHSAHQVWMAQADRVFRSIDGGHQWALQPQNKNSFPANSAVNSIAPCSFDFNHVWVAGESSTAGVGGFYQGIPAGGVLV